jgi:hypothetical protein
MAALIVAGRGLTETEHNEHRVAPSGRTAKSRFANHRMTGDREGAGFFKEGRQNENREGEMQFLDSRP